MRKYVLVDKPTADAIDADAGTVERLTGVEIGYIEWVIEEDGKFENGDWTVYSSQHSGDPSGTEDLFAKWNRACKR